MLSQNVAKTTVPSYSHIRTNLPTRPTYNQWQGVFYFSGITKRHQNSILLTRKKAAEAATAAHSATTSALAQRFTMEYRRKLFPMLSVDGSTSTASASSSLPVVAPASIVSRDTAPQWLAFAVELSTHGLVDLAAPVMDALHAARLLSAADYAQLLDACAADALGVALLRSTAAYDPTLVPKLLADRRGLDRAATARRLFTMAVDAGVTVTAAHMNGLMKTMLTAGFDAASTVSGSLYDHMGSVGIQPNATTYELVLLSLALQGNVEEAEQVLAFVQTHASDHLTIGHYNALLHGFRDARLYDKCDQLWQEVCDRRWPRPSVATVELYLRSIVDHSYQTLSDPMTKLGNVNVVEKKKIPAVLKQMDELAIPRTLLSPYLLDEVEDALRKFSIYRTRFYEWGRATRQFDFIEYRRRHGWMQDIPEMVPPTEQSTALRSSDDKPDSSYAPVATAEVPGFFTARNAWEQPVLDNLLNISVRKEKMEDTRSADFYYDDKRSIHEREAGWMQVHPETRYDQLYGMANPDIPKIGIRRHLDAEYTNRADVLEKDQSIMKKALTGGRRVRQKVEAARTHRNAGGAQ